MVLFIVSPSPRVRASLTSSLLPELHQQQGCRDAATGGSITGAAALGSASAIRRKLDSLAADDEDNARGLGLIRVRMDYLIT